ncbi:TPA: Ig-like domain-containing protein [Photobacterium damselae]
MSLNTYVAKSVAIAIAVALSGCGGGDSSSDTTPTPQPPPKPESKLLALDGFSTVKPDTKTRVNLSSFVRGDNVKIVSATVEGDDSQCGVPTVDGTSLDITAGNGAYCSYSYLAQSGDIQSYAQLRVLATDAAVPMLPPVSQAMVLGGSNLSLNLETLLDSDWPTGYQLNSSSIKVQGSEGNLGSIVSTTGNTIVYKGPELSGWNRLVYVISNPAKPGEDKMGTVYITVSEQINQPPAIAEPKYDYNKNNPSSLVTAGKTVVLDLNSLPNLGITEPDSQDWQLIDVQSYSATVAPTNPNSVTNKSFNFNAGTVGEHYVSYIIADHFGGYSSGLIKITVSAKENPVTWNSISSNGNTFTAPLIYSQALDKGLNVSAQWDNDVNNTVAGFGQNTGTLYCDTIGVLPSVSELGSLRNDSSSTTKLNLWPKQKTYLAQNNGTVVGYNLQTGSTQAYNESVPYYVTCIENQDMSLKMLTYTVIANNTRVPVAVVGQPSASSTITLSKVEGTLSDEDVALLQDKLSEDREKNITTQSTKTGTYRFRITNTADALSTLISGLINYVGDPETARATIPNIRAFPNGITQSVIPVTVKDFYNNPISNLSTSLTSSDTEDTLIPVRAMTDSAGQVSFSGSFSTAEERTVTVMNESREIGEITITPSPRHWYYVGGHTGNTITFKFDAAETEFNTDGSVKDEFTNTVVIDAGFRFQTSYTKDSFKAVSMGWTHKNWNNTYYGLDLADQTCWERGGRFQMRAEHGTLYCVPAIYSGSRDWYVHRTDLVPTQIVHTGQAEITKDVTLTNFRRQCLSNSVISGDKKRTVIVSGVLKIGDPSCDILSVSGSWSNSGAPSNISGTMSNNKGLQLLNTVIP